MAKREIAEIEAYAVGHASLGAVARRQPSRALRAKGFTDAVIAKLEARAGERVRHQVRLQQMDARRRFP